MPKTSLSTVILVKDNTPDAVNWGNILASNGMGETQNTNQTFTGINSAVEITLTFSASTYSSTSSLQVYKNNSLIQTISTNTRPDTTTVNQTFVENDTLKFGYTSDSDNTWTLFVNNTSGTTVQLDSMIISSAGFG